MLALPFVAGPYGHTVRAAEGAELRQVDQPGRLAGVVKWLQAGAEVRPLVYEPLGWADGQTFVYRMWRGAGYDRTGAWQDGVSGSVMAYDVAVGASRPWDGALDGLHRTCRQGPLDTSRTGAGRFPVCLLRGRHQPPVRGDGLHLCAPANPASGQHGGDATEIRGEQCPVSVRRVRSTSFERKSLQNHPTTDICSG